MNCRNCKTQIIPFFSLGQTPLVNSFLKKEEIAHEKKYDLSVGFCPICYLVQLINIVPPEKLFRNYIYFSSTSKSFLDHCKKTAEDLTKRFNLTKESLVLEIASNDGAQLRYFKALGLKILGVDPAKNIAEVANKNGIYTIAEFFNYTFAKKLKKEKHVQADLVFGANVLAHVPQIVDFVKGVKEILTPKGTAVFEFPYVRGLMENKFDIIYHEHVFYYSLIALINVFKNAGLEIYDVQMTKTQGGSLRIFASHTNNFQISDTVKNLKSQEIKLGFDKIETYEKMSNNISVLKKDIIDLLSKLKKEGKKIVAYSAPAKGNILLNYFGINKNYLDFIVDKSKKKHGLYAPGTHLLIYPIEKIYKENPNYLLILCWNIADEVIHMKELKDYRRHGGKFIIPIPKIKIIEKNIMTKKNTISATSMRVPYGLSVHGQEEIDAVVKVLKGNTALGNDTKKFEQKIAVIFGKKYGIMVNSGSSANLLAFELLNLPKGSEVITPLLTFSTTVAPIIQKGLVPVFVDVDLDTYLINISQIEKAITKKTGALMIPSLLGNIPNLKQVSKIAKKYKLFLIEDSCDTLDGKVHNRPSGAYSDISTTSFYGSHIINGAGGGGMICVNKAAWADRLVVLRGWGRRSSLFGEKTNSEQFKNRFRTRLSGVPYDEKFTFSEIGYNFLPLELSAAFGLAQLKKFPKFKMLRKKHFASLYTFFTQYSNYFILPRQTPNTKTAWLAFPLIVKRGAPFNRFDIVKYLEEHNIQTRPVFTGDITLQPGFSKITHRKPCKDYPNTKYIMQNAFVVGCHQGLTNIQLAYVKKTVEDFLFLYKK